MEGFEINLLFGNGHKISDSSLDILSVVDVEVGHFHGGDLPVESVEDWKSEAFLALSPEVEIGKGEEPGPSRCFSEEMEIGGISDKPHDEISTPEDQGFLPSHSEIFVMWGNLLCSHHIDVSLDGIESGVKRPLVQFIEGMDISLLS